MRYPLTRQGKTIAYALKLSIRPSFEEGRVDLYAKPANDAGMKKIQYTIRGIPARLDARIRERALKEGRPLNEIVVEALKVGIGLSESPVRHTDIDD